jgi:hypothetical protein
MINLLHNCGRSISPHSIDRQYPNDPPSPPARAATPFIDALASPHRNRSRRNLADGNSAKELGTLLSGFGPPLLRLIRKMISRVHLMPYGDIVTSPLRRIAQLS